MLEQHLLLYIKHIDLTRLGTESGAADDGKRASSVAWSCMAGRKALGEGVWGRGRKTSLGGVMDLTALLADLYPFFSRVS